MPRPSRMVSWVTATAAVSAVVLLLTSSAAAVGVEDGSNTLESETSSRVFFQHFPRYDFGMQEVGSTFNMSNSQYQESIVMMGVPFYALGGILALFYGIVFCLRWNCDTCGSRIPRKLRYRKKSRLVVKVLVTVMAISLLPVVSYTAYSHYQVYEAGDAIITTIANSAQDHKTAVTNFNHNFLSLSYPSSTDTVVVENGVIAVDDLLSDATDQVSTARTRESSVGDAELGRNVISGMAYLVVILATLAALSLILTSRESTAFCFAFLSALGLPLICAIAGIHISYTVALGDFCEEVDSFTENAAVRVLNEDLRIYTIDGLPADSIPILEEVQVVEDPSGITTWLVHCPPLIASNVTTVVFNFQLDAVSDLLATETDPTAIQEYTELLASYNELTETLELSTDCGFVLDTITKQSEEICGEVVDSLVSLIGAQTFLAVVLLFAPCVGLMAAKRLPNHGRDLELLGEDPGVSMGTMGAISMIPVAGGGFMAAQQHQQIPGGTVLPAGGLSIQQQQQMMLAMQQQQQLGVVPGAVGGNHLHQVSALPSLPSIPSNSRPVSSSGKKTPSRFRGLVGKRGSKASKSNSKKNKSSSKSSPRNFVRSNTTKNIDPPSMTPGAHDLQRSSRSAGAGSRTSSSRSSTSRSLAAVPATSYSDYSDEDSDDSVSGVGPAPSRGSRSSSLKAMTDTKKTSSRVRGLSPIRGSPRSDISPSRASLHHRGRTRSPVRSLSRASGGPPSRSIHGSRAGSRSSYRSRPASTRSTRSRASLAPPAVLSDSGSTDSDDAAEMSGVTVPRR